MSRLYVLDDDLNPVQVDDYAEASRWSRRHPGRGVIRQERVGKAMISTTFLNGIDHNWTGHGPPILWETMVFSYEKGEDYQERYSSAAEALAGHIRIVERVKRGENLHED